MVTGSSGSVRTKRLLAASFTLARTGPRPVLLERDNDIPPLSELLNEARTLRAVYDGAVQRFHEDHAASA